VREHLPALRGVAYLNAGTNGPLPDAALEAMRAELDRQALEPRIGPAAYARWGEVRDRTRQAAAGVVGGRPEDIALTSSTTQGVGLVCAGLPWREGDEVITTTEEHPGLLGPLHELTGRFGVRVRAVEASEVAAAMGPDTRMLAVSHVLWTTGRVLPLPELAQAAHSAGAVVLVDGAQSAGNIAVDAPASGVDYYAFSGQKWLMGPQGSGALWVNAEAVERLTPATPGYLTYADGKVGNYREGACRFDAGTIDPVTLTGLAAAIEFVDRQPGGRGAWTRTAAANATRAREQLDAVDGLSVADPGGPASCLIAIELAEGDSAEVAQALGEQGVLVRNIPGTPYLRISVGAWTDDSDIDRFCAALYGLA